MNAVTRVGAFGAGVAIAFGAAFGIGRVADLGMPRAEGAGAGVAEDHGHDAETPPSGGSHATAGNHGTTEEQTAAPTGLSATDQGYRLVLDADTAVASASAVLRFRVLDPSGRALTAYTTRHEKQLHLIVVRRDLTGYQHVHPTLAADGSWATTVDLHRPGQWRVLADFDPAGDIPPLVLGTDLAVPGNYSPVAVADGDDSVTVDGYSVRRTGNLSPTAANPVAFTVARTDGAPVDLQPYLGADGHLVVLRAGDLAYAHAHPVTAASDMGAGAQGMAFSVETPGAGAYRLFFEFDDAGRVHTATFTAQAGGTGHGG